jgi:hypothetical protein
MAATSAVAPAAAVEPEVDGHGSALPVIAPHLQQHQRRTDRLSLETTPPSPPPPLPPLTLPPIKAMELSPLLPQAALSESSSQQQQPLPPQIESLEPPSQQQQSALPAPPSPLPPLLAMLSPLWSLPFWQQPQ